MSNGPLTSKEFDLKTLNIISSSGLTIPIEQIFVQLEIYQDIYSSVMHGNVLINDVRDIFSNFYFCGNEYIQIIVDKPGLNQPIDKVFRIYKTSDRTRTGNSSQGYLLHFCSDEFILSNSMRISRAYVEATASDIVYDVLVNHLKVPTTSIYNLEVSGGIYDFVVPNYRPFEAIQWAAARAYSDENKFCYFFFENSRGYNFISLQSMYEKEAVKDIKIEAKKAAGADPADTQNSAEELKILSDFDVLTSLSNGAFASKMLEVDIFSRTYNNYFYSLQQAEDQGLLLNQHKSINGLKDITGNTAMTSFDSYYTAYAQINDTAAEKKNSVDKWLMPRSLHMSLINNTKIQITIPGDTMLNVGDIVNFNFPKFTTPDEAGKEDDKMRTCKYLITAINHKFMGDKFISILELATDSFGSALPAAADLQQVLKAS